ncbi:MAG: hypothetical protein K0S68_236 [Candidatus Saccharibacteria bacterium]|nr:hypothetical protein [Candidatus Saccharibacteria bacterium]
MPEGIGAPSPQEQGPSEVEKKAVKLYDEHKDIVDAVKVNKAMDKIADIRRAAIPKLEDNRARAAEFARDNIEALQTEAAADMAADANKDTRPKLDVVPDHPEPEEGKRAA